MKWISTTESLPPPCQQVLVVKHYLDAEWDFEKGGYDEEKVFNTPHFVTIDFIIFNFSKNFSWNKGGIVSHWMPIPKIPNGE